MRRRISSVKLGPPALPRRVARSRGVSGGLLVWAACSRITCRMVGGVRSSWSRRKSSGWTASSPSGASAAAGKSFALAVMMACATPRIAAASACRPDQAVTGRLRVPETSASSKASRICAKRLPRPFPGGSTRWPPGPRRGCGRTTAGGTGLLRDAEQHVGECDRHEHAGVEHYGIARHDYEAPSGRAARLRAFFRAVA
jgi:hypothetical protein